MTGVVLKPALLLTIIFILSASIIHAQPYNDLALHALNIDDCLAPCFIGIRPGVTSMRRAVSIVETHGWIANARFPALVRNAVFYDAAVPRTRIEWRWSDAAPHWLNRIQVGGLMFENREVQDITIDTSLSLGEIFLAFGSPDHEQYLVSNSSTGKRLEYNAWFADEGMLVSAQGVCAVWNRYHSPARVIFRLSAPQFPESVPNRSVCA